MRLNQEKRASLVKTSKGEVHIMSVFIGKIMQRGVRTRAVKQLSTALLHARKILKLRPDLILNQAIENVKPVVDLRRKVVAGRTYYLPTPILGGKDVRLGVSWLVDSARSSSGMSFSYRLGQELINAVQGTGRAVQRKREHYRIVRENRAFLSMRKFR